MFKCVNMYAVHKEGVWYSWKYNDWFSELFEFCITTSQTDAEEVAQSVQGKVAILKVEVINFY